MKPNILVDAPHHNAEVPLWHEREGCLYWTDIPQGQVFRHYPHNNKTEQIYSGEPVGGMTIQTDGSLLLFKTKGTIQRWHKGNITTLIAEIPAERNTRFNDAIADPQGRVFSGTVATPKRSGHLYRLDCDGSLHQILDGLIMPNGMGFTPDRQQFYFTDSERRIIYRFKYDRATGKLSNRRIFVVTPTDEGVPDGLTVDAEGYVWSARWNGGHLFRYNPQGQEVGRIAFPARKISSVIFGGDNCDRVYVTTAGGDYRTQEGSGAGAIFQLQPGVRGVPEFPSRILL
ncbi:SMP-30/gluconolactonase/LRE family protein [Myxosarcina sp. GI1]|uniref:SMP-30/gluconolactonase/LRE family protein n=1 Tax=Myxosarcina sp. GI1 TaxID=1541065 RepID=UPI000560902B|nr:SMP-30/gluconolactonase/LRE family protein [Myxosarcina sp. GI1]